MPDPDDDHRQAVALFRYGVIADLIHLPPGSPGITDKLRAKASQEYLIPGSRRSRIAAETIRDWLKRLPTAASPGGCRMPSPRR